MKFIILCILISISISCQNNSPRHNRETDPYSLRENLHRSFLDGKGRKTFPSYYGGSYVEDSSLVIIVIGDTLRSKKDLLERCNGTNFTLLYCKERQEAVRKILHYLQIFRTGDKNKEIVERLQFRSSYMNAENRVSIELLTF